jgi:hypothetical protein
LAGQKGTGRGKGGGRKRRGPKSHSCDNCRQPLKFLIEADHRESHSPVGLRAARLPIASQTAAAVGSWLRAVARHLPARAVSPVRAYSLPRAHQAGTSLGSSCRALPRAYSLVPSSLAVLPRAYQSPADLGSSLSPPARYFRRSKMLQEFSRGGEGGS